MLRKEIIKKFINTEDIQHIIWHHGSVFIKDTFTTALYLFVLYIIYFVLSSYIKWAFLPWIFGLIGIGFFIKFILIFLNTYLDGLVLSSQGITLFMREGLTKYKTDFFDWEKIQTVSHNQNSWWDKVFAKGDILIRLDHDIDFPFKNVHQPSKQVSKILQIKERFLAGKKQQSASTPGIDKDKLSILTEALSEVVKEYLDKKGAETSKEV